MPLRPIHLDDSFIGRPIPWDLYTASGVLVARAGLTVDTAEFLSRLTVRPLYRESGNDLDGAALLERLHRLMRVFPLAYKSAGTELLEPEIRRHARELIALAQADHDACLGLLRLLPMPDPASRQCLLAALVALDMAEQILPPDDPRLETIVCAAMTMNIAAMRLHAELAKQRTIDDETKREALARHPLDSFKLLEEGGLQDPVWLAAVKQHHENLDGSGYPNGLRGDEIGEDARLIRVADYFAAKIQARSYRPAMTSRDAYKHLFGSERNRLDGHLAQLLLRRLGMYLPGSLLRLANKEIAVVTRKQNDGHTPGKVLAFLGPNGRLLKEPVARDTTSVHFATLNVTEPEHHWPEVRWETFWGY